MKIKIPKGWRKVPTGWRIREGDRFIYSTASNISANQFIGAKVTNTCTDYGLTIRRITPAKKRGKKWRGKK